MIALVGKVHWLGEVKTVGQPLMPCGLSNPVGLSETSSSLLPWFPVFSEDL